MKKFLLFFAFLFIVSAAVSQLKSSIACANFSVDILNGKVNELYASSGNGEVKGKFPCFTSIENEVASSKCGGFVFYKDKDIYFYTGRDYIEIGEKFKGKLSIPLLGAARANLFKWLGHPKIKDTNWDAFQMAYGTLVLYYKGAKVNKIQFSTRNSDNMSVCE